MTRGVRWALLAGAVAAASACWNFDADFEGWCGDHPGQCTDAGADPDDAGAGQGNDGGLPQDGGDGLDGGAEDAGLSDGGEDAGCIGTVDFVAGWEDGGISPFTAFEAKSMTSQFHLDDGANSDPVREGTYAGWFQVKSGDLHSTSGEERSMAVAATGEQDGDAFFYGFSLYLPAATTFSGADSRYLLRWESDSSGVAGPLRVRGWSGELQVVLAPTQGSGERVISLGPATTGVWHDIVLHVVWSKSAGGSVQAFHRVGAAAYAEMGTLSGQTIESTSGVSLHTDVGITRNASTLTETVIHDAFRRGTSFCAVAP